MQMGLGCGDCCKSFLAIHILNVNQITDDNFDIKLNGNLIGTTSLATNGVCQGKVFTDATDFDLARDFCAAHFYCCLSYGDTTGAPCGVAPDCTADQTKQTFSSLLKVVGLNTLDMTNTADNGAGNYGRVWAYLIKWNGTNYVIDSTPLNNVYSGAAGASFHYTFTL